jgi:apolipoprotein N-acyltransferase
MRIFVNKLSISALAIIGGLMMWASWPMSPIPFFLFVGFIPLLLAEKRIANLPPERKKGWLFFGASYLFLLTWNALTTWWVCYASVAGGLFAIFANALLQSLPMLAFFHCKRRLGNFWGYVSLVVFWIAFEYLHLNWDLSWSWLTLGNGLAYWPQLAQWYEVTGALGGSVWLLLSNILVFHWLLEENSSPKIKYWISGVFVLPLLLSVAMYFSYQTPSESVEVVVIQPNIDPYTEKFNNSPLYIPLEQQIGRMISLSEQKITPKTLWVLWPETAVDAMVAEHTIEDEPIIQQIKQQFTQKYPHIHLLTGITSYHVFPNKESATATARYAEGVGHYDAYNTALHIKHGQPIGIYHKSKLVPAVEQLPYPAFFKFLMAFVIDLGGTSGGLGKQTEREVFTADNTSIAPVICYESVYGDFNTEFIRKGANFIGIITNDGWWNDTPGHRQHWAYASLRAIETRRDIARSANTGISGFVNGRGDRLNATQYWTQATLNGQVALNSEQTLYTKFGDYIGLVFSVLTGIFIVLALTKRVK